MSLRMIDGFEHGVLSTSGGGLYSSIVEFGTLADFSTTVVKTGTRSLRMRNASRIGYPTLSGTPNIACAGMWINWAAYPSVTEVEICSFLTNSGATPWIEVNTDGSLQLAEYDGVSTTNVDSGTVGVLPTNAWVWIEFYVDVSANPHVIRIRFNGVEREFQTAVAATTLTRLQLWNNGYSEAGDLTRYYDDVAIYAGSAADWPISPKRVLPKALNAVATHNLEAATSKYYFKDIAGTETFLTSSETDSYQTIDDSPLNQDVDHIGLKGVNIGFDNGTESHGGTTGSQNEAFFDMPSWTCNSRTRGILVFVMVANANADDALSVKISPATNNIDVPVVTGSLAQDTAGEPGSCKAFFIGSGLSAVAGGSIVIRVNRNNNANIMYGVAVSIVADIDLEVTGVTTVSGDGTLAEQSINDGSPGQNSLRFAGLYSGLASNPTVGANSSLLGNIDFGQFVAGAVRETTQGQGARGVGFSSGTSDDRAYVALAVRGVIPQAGPAHYVEYALENDLEVSNPLAIRIITALRQDVAQLCAIDIAGYDGSAEQTYVNDLSINSTANIYNTSIAEQNPSGGAWTNPVFDALRLRWGKTSNPSGIPRLAAMQVEVLHNDIKHVAVFNRQDMQHRKSRW